MERVADVLRHRHPQFNTTSSRRKITEAIHQMQCENVDYLIVLEGDRFAGLVTERDITAKLLQLTTPLERTPVIEFVNCKVPVAGLNDSLEHCLRLMEDHRARHLIIYDGFEFVGVLSSYELVRAVINGRKSFFEDEPVPRDYPWNY